MLRTGNADVNASAAVCPKLRSAVAPQPMCISPPPLAIARLTSENCRHLVVLSYCLVVEHQDLLQWQEEHRIRCVCRHACELHRLQPYCHSPSWEGLCPASARRDLSLCCNGKSGASQLPQVRNTCASVSSGPAARQFQQIRHLSKRHTRMLPIARHHLPEDVQAIKVDPAQRHGC